MDVPEQWTAETTEKQCHQVLDDLGYGPRHLSLLRMGENATYRVRDQGVVIRLTRPYLPMEAVEHEIACARYLEEIRFPAARLVGSIELPISTPLGYVTLWEEIQGRPAGDADTRALGILLRRLHGLRPTFNVRPWRPLVKVPERLAEIRRQGVVPVTSVAQLESVFQSLAREVDQLQADEAEVATWGLRHGDAYTGNLLIAEHGAVLLDWEDASWGPEAWDTSETQMSYVRFGLRRESYEAFAEGFGQLPDELPHADLCRRVREITATSWLLQNAAHAADVLDEGLLRIDGIVRGSSPRIWRGF